ncbi:alpha/beta hydrolase [Ruminococcus albus]|uniref:Predicted hydrolase of the alpha/beta superfamily n=1 Tax=Ruminococcus albus TaxID=1264 RepID=A0A1I1CV61_RUMAL|nr:alpha/beta hydrolase-fold protein [Ruminococcus albus]SFB66414.1 Predicted hydrolase of the alpha/beta superfamily [Ruminococcus albus]
MKKDTIIIGGRSCTVYADTSPEFLLIQPTDKHEIELLAKEIEHIKSLTDTPFAFAAFEITDWNRELSPWEAPPVFGNEPLGNGAGETLAFIEDTLIPKLIEQYSLNKDIPVILGGYSLAGLFALWAGYNSDRFTAVAAISPSVWFPGWLEFIEKHFPAVKSIYLSLGNKEEKTRNKIMAVVGDNIRRQYEMLNQLDLNVTLEWNEGNHFTEPEMRTAKGFAWCVNRSSHQ